MCTLTLSISYTCSVMLRLGGLLSSCICTTLTSGGGCTCSDAFREAGGVGGRGFRFLGDPISVRNSTPVTIDNVPKMAALSTRCWGTESIEAYARLPTKKTILIA